MRRFIRAVVKVGIEKGISHMIEALVPGFGPQIARGYEFCSDVFREWAVDASLAERNADVLALSHADAAEAEAEADAAIRELAPHLSAEDIITLKLVAAQIPEVTRQSLKRKDDPTGRSLPNGFAVKDADDVQLILPRAPRYRPGMSLHGQPGWRLDSLLGIGGFGEVWLATHRSGQQGAVKFCLGLDIPALKHELELVARVMDRADEFPALVPVLFQHLNGDPPWVMYEYVRGGSLTGRIHAWQMLPKADRINVITAALRELAMAVAELHKLRVVHRDLKPANVLWDEDKRRLRITDFGIGGTTARATQNADTRGETTRGVELLSYLRGSHSQIYSSPQQRLGDDPDPRDDVHSLGVIGYQMFTGNLTNGVGTDAADDLREEGVSEELITLLGKCVAQKAERRPANAGEMYERLPQSIEQSDAWEMDESLPQSIEQTEWQITVPGRWFRRPVNHPNATWEEVGDTPATVTTRADEEYCLNGSTLVTDEALAGLAHIARLTALTSLDLGFTPVMDAGLAHIARLTALTSLDLECTWVGDAGLAHIARLTALTTLDLNCTLVTDAGLARIATLTALTSLELGFTLVTDAGLAHIARLTALTSLYLGSTQVTDAGLANLQAVLPNCTISR